MINIFVGNLDFSVTEGQLRTAFGVHGVVETVTVVMDRDTGQPRGFAFVEMPNDKEAEQAISALDGSQLNARVLRVNEARAKAGSDDDFRGRSHRRHRI